jgi:hypothetical protein
MRPCLRLGIGCLPDLDRSRSTVAPARPARAEAGRLLVALPQTAGRTESEIFFDALALNEPAPRATATPAGEELLGAFTAELATAFRARRELLTQEGWLLPGAREAVAEVASGRSSAAELRDAGADVVLAGLADPARVVRAIAGLTSAATAGRRRL